ncbi:hypothetical protein HWV62_4908 [Athelia sp. TMB]|nr:hypothetical protein HWV62_4908 [Athelia sp. TMB]
MPSANSPEKRWSMEALDQPHTASFFYKEYPVITAFFPFFERMWYEDADMDLYAHPGFGREAGHHLMAIQGYQYMGGSRRRISPSQINDPEEFAIDELEARESSYAAIAVHDVLEFRRIDGDGRMRDIQLVITINSCFETIMRFHSSESVLQFIIR